MIKTLTVLVRGDAAQELTETFAVNLSRPSNARIADARGIGTILNDEVLVPPPSWEYPEQPYYDTSTGNCPYYPNC